MDYTVLYVVLLSLGTLGLIIGGMFAAKKFNFSNEEIVEGIDVGIAVVIFGKNVAIDLGIDKEDAEKYGNLLFETLEYMKVIDDGKEKQITEGIEYAYEQAELFGIELNEEREYIISAIVRLGFNVYYAIVKSAE